MRGERRAHAIDSWMYEQRSELTASAPLVPRSPRRSSIGFLSLFEHYENIEVGSFLKQPVYPIWVICSESHYTVGWCLDSAATTSIPGNGVFDLMYYDELANQKEEIKLTIDTTKKGAPPKDGDLEPPINECIRTKWGKNARIDWNGVEPIL
jgi:hypothetical protein